MHPAAKERYVEAPAPRPLTRLYYEADDGWRAPLLYLPPVPGGAGEPVVLAHALGFGADAFRYGTGSTLAGHLSDAGFAVYLLTHRGDRDAIAPDRRGFTFDDVVEHDVPAALARVREHARYPRAHWVGHGLGGQLGLAWAARSAADGLASVVALCAAVRFEVTRSEARRAVVVAGLLPAHWSLPARSLGPFVAPWIDEGRDLLEHVRPGTTSPDRLRGVLHHAVEDLPIGLVRQMSRWLSAGSLVDAHGLLDYPEALRDARVPLLVGVAGGDRVCAPACGSAALDTWGGEGDLLVFPDTYGHLDPLLARDAEARVFGPVKAWLSERRRLAWERDGEAAFLGRV
jgi:oxygen-independent coproporphyrinogen-3 oxidase